METGDQRDGQEAFRIHLPPQEKVSLQVWEAKVVFAENKQQTETKDVMFCSFNKTTVCRDVVCFSCLWIHGAYGVAMFYILELFIKPVWLRLIKQQFIKVDM